MTELVPAPDGAADVADVAPTTRAAEVAAGARAAVAGAAHGVAEDVVTAVEAADVRRARHAPRPLRAFNDAGVLRAADVHVALRLLALGGEADMNVALAAALAVRGPRLGHVFVDLATIAERATVDDADEPAALPELPWPPVDAWTRALAASAIVAVGEDDGGPAQPLRLVGSRLYLDRYWREERQIAADLRVLARDGAPGLDEEVLAAGLARLFAGDGLQGECRVREADAHELDTPRGRATAGYDRQRLAAATATLRRFAVVAGGPGTGKTTTVARILALIAEQAAAAGAPRPLVALAAPTGKAAARLEEAVHAEAARLPLGDDVREQLLALGASTLHRLLGWRPGSHSRFRHDRSNRLAYDVVVVDETSMVSLTMMARLVEAVRPDARLILVGDPGQLTSIEAGAVLGDIVGPAATGPRMRAPARRALERVTGASIDPSRPAAANATGDGGGVGSVQSDVTLGAGDAARQPATGDGGGIGADEDSGIGDGIVVLDRSHRFGAGIAALADAVRRGDAGATIAALRDARTPEVDWIEADLGEAADPALLTRLRADAVASALAAMRASAAGDALRALEAIGAFRLLCAHRRGPHGAATWRARIESWLVAEIPGLAAQGAWYVGRPLLVTENDYGLRLFNGDTGVVVVSGDGDGRVAAAFERRGEIVRISPARLEAVDTVYAMTIHKAQGSQFDTAAVVLPPAGSPLMTRELLYTAVTRARTRLVVAATEEAVRSAVGCPVARASGLRSRLWGDEFDR